MMFTIVIGTGNDAFNPVKEIEIARILRKCVGYLEAKAEFGDGGSYEFSLMDINGNKVGIMSMKEVVS